MKFLAMASYTFCVGATTLFATCEKRLPALAFLLGSVVFFFVWEFLKEMEVRDEMGL